jgi:hypothetical protein
MRKIVVVAIIVLLVAVLFLTNTITGFLVAGNTATTDKAAYCGNGECSNDEDCESCPADCGLCRLRASDVDVDLEWRDLYKSANATELCSGYDRGSVYGTIKLSGIEKGVYFCTANFTDIKVSFGVEGTTSEILAKDRSLKQEQKAELCCHSYSMNPDFCKTITLDAYC